MSYEEIYTLHAILITYNVYIDSHRLYSDEKVYNAAQALLKADLSVKTTSADPKNIVSVLIAEIMQ